MPVTKKKGAIFAIYADSPVRSSSPPTTYSTSTVLGAKANSITNINKSKLGGSPPRSPSKRAALGTKPLSTSSMTGKSSRKVLSSLPPTALRPSSSASESDAESKKSKSTLKAKSSVSDGSAGAGLGGLGENALKPQSRSKLGSVQNVGAQALVQPQSQSRSYVQAPTKSRTKSSISVFSDAADGETVPKSASASQSTSTLRNKTVLSASSASAIPGASSTLRRVGLGVSRDDIEDGVGTLKTRRFAGSASDAGSGSLLPPAQLSISTSSSSQAIKRSRDLLSPLPIIAHSAEGDSHRARPAVDAASSSTEAIVDHRHIGSGNGIGESPAKRNRISALSTPSRGARTTGNGSFDKENVPPPDTPDDLDGSPATRTRSKIRALSISGGPAQTQSPLRTLGSSSRARSGFGGPTATARGGDSALNSTSAARRIESLIGDGRGTLTLKKGRELAVMMENDTGLFKELEENPVARPHAVLSGNGGGKGAGKGKGNAVAADGALVDVSEAYGASGEEPEGFRMQRR